MRVVCGVGEVVGAEEAIASKIVSRVERRGALRCPGTMTVAAGGGRGRGGGGIKLGRMLCRMAGRMAVLVEETSEVDGAGKRAFPVVGARSPDAPV